MIEEVKHTYIPGQPIPENTTNLYCAGNGLTELPKLPRNVVYELCIRKTRK
jgi:hypothetical protein